MTNQVVRLNYPSTLLRVPIINQLIKQYDLTVNIMRAEIDNEKGWIEIQLAGNIQTIEDAIEWLRLQGVNVEFIQD
ncbi:MAG: NIL domain-containing protein [Anaerolineales bacterium]